MKKIVCIVALPALLAMACSDSKPEKDNSLVVPAEATTAPAVVDAASTPATDAASINPATDAVLPTTTTVSEPAKTSTQAAPAPAKTATTAALNPAHGEPGHRCDIPVGAPLNSPAQASGPQNIINPVNTAPSPNVPIAQPSLPISTGASGKLNPPHGEPGHNCAVPVGSPLP